jgi:hypothetical protein
LSILLDIADIYAQRICSEGFHKNFPPLVIPKEIHTSLERVFRKKEDGTSSVETYHILKESLSTLLNFEE